MTSTTIMPSEIRHVLEWAHGTWGQGGCSHPKFGLLRFFGQQEKFRQSKF